MTQPVSHILLLGPGTSTRRIDRPGEFGDDPSERLTVVDRAWSAYEFWKGKADAHCEDVIDSGILHALWWRSETRFQDLHAYEILNLLPGNEDSFFGFWKAVWKLLHPGALVYATTPHWNSRYIHAYPGPQRVYTPELLAYLDPEVKLGSKSDFGTLWPKPYRFEAQEMSEILNVKREPLGFRFVLRKAEAK